MSRNTDISHKARILLILLTVVLAVGSSLVSALPVAADSVSFYVATTGDNTNNGLSWQTAWQDIQYAIDQADVGDTINVAAGIYNENITLKDGVAILGVGADVTVIDGGDNGTVVTADSVGSTTRLEGFTITHGNAQRGGGMYNKNSSPTVTGCVFSSNLSACGGGMYNNHSSPTVDNCILWDSDNEIYNVISTPVVSYCDIGRGYIGEGNIDADPLFVDPAAGDFCLSPGSPCLGAGNNALVPDWLTTDFEGDPRIADGGDNIAVVDMGADESYLPPNNPPQQFTTSGDAEGTVASASLPPSSGESEVVEMVDISVAVTNTTNSVGSYTVILKINDAVKATKELTLDAGAIESATFTVPSGEAGSYSVIIEGAGGSFTVTAPQGALPEAETSSRWFVVGGIIAGVVIIGLLFFFFVVKKRARWAIYLWFR